MTRFHIRIRSDEHPRTINTYRNQRTNYTQFTVEGWEALENKVAELIAAGEYILHVVTDLGTRVAPNDKAKFA